MICTELPRVHVITGEKLSLEEKFEIWDLFIYKAGCLNTEVFDVIHCKGVCERKYYVMGLYLSVLV